MNTTENNKIIAEFMGWEIIENQSDFFVDCNPDKEQAPLQLLNEVFKDWNFLIEVVEKIQNVPSYDKDRFGTSVKIEGRNCTIKSDNYGIKGKEYSKEKYFNATFNAPTKIEAVYNACLEFIKWYSEANK